MSFTVTASCPETKARAGILKTPRGDVQTPAFMPVATLATVKALSSEDLASLGVRAILANAYHLYLRPGVPEVAAAGGLHRFMAYDGMILTDSGGFQVMSLSELRQIDDDGVTFKSHLDGSLHRLTPEKVVEIQAGLASDCWTCLDVCPPYPAEPSQVRDALTRTKAWIERSAPAVQKARGAGARSLFFPILQGGLVPELRAEAARHMAGIASEGVALGGFSVGEPKELTWDVLGKTTPLLPPERARYLMGVGTPEDLWEAAAQGVDMMDCVYPTRVARNGQVMTRRGRFNIDSAACKGAQGPIDGECSCFVCRKYSRSYLRHLYISKELSAYRFLTYHNLHLMLALAGEIRESLRAGRFAAARKAFLDAREPKKA